MSEKKLQSFTHLNAWKEGHKLVILIYQQTSTFPQEEQFGITNQMRRCVISIVSNIAEGFGRQSYKEKTQFYSVAQGSNLELQAQLLAARDIGFMKPESFKLAADQSVVVGKLLSGLIKSTKEFSTRAKIRDSKI